jgi:hypothetical protein
MGFLFQVRLFADDCLLYRQIKNREDHILLQNVLTWLEEWAHKWGMRFLWNSWFHDGLVRLLAFSDDSHFPFGEEWCEPFVEVSFYSVFRMRFNVKKCYVMSIKGKSSCLYNLDKTVLQQVTENPYLGILLSEDLGWSKHPITIVNCWMMVAQASCHKQINKQSSNNHCYKQSFQKKITCIFFYYKKRYNNQVQVLQQMQPNVIIMHTNLNYFYRYVFLNLTCQAYQKKITCIFFYYKKRYNNLK